MNEKKLILVVLGIVSFMSFSERIGYGQPTTNSEVLNIPVKEVKIQGESLSSILSDIATKLSVPIGLDSTFAHGSQCNVRGELRISLRNTNVGKIIDRVFQETSGCQWTISEGVINFLPSSSVLRLTEIRLARFEVKRGSRKQDVKLKLTQSDEIRKNLEGHDMLLTSLSTDVLGDQKTMLDFEIEKGDYSLQWILNKMAVTNKGKFWSLSQWSSESKEIFINF
jgi:hypothetical protein